MDKNEPIFVYDINILSSFVKLYEDVILKKKRAFVNLFMTMLVFDNLDILPRKYREFYEKVQLLCCFK